MKEVECYCGGDVNPHSVGFGGCFRKLVQTPQYIGQTNKGVNLWEVEGCEITQFTMIEQRGYHHHGKGVWSVARNYNENSIGEV